MRVAEIKLSAPAHRALVDAGIIDLEQLANFTEAEILALHGMGPKALKLLSAKAQAHNISFKQV